MNILLAGALSWNPERVLALTRMGHRLYGLWSRTMAWEQGPYAFADGIITDLDVESAIDLLRDRKIDIVYSLFQVYDARLWSREAARGVEDLWSQLTRLLIARGKGAFDAPIVRHWGFDVHNLDLEIVRALDGQIFCNPQKLRYWTAPRAEGGCGLNLGCERQPIAFMDSDLPSREFMNHRFSPRFSERDGEIHTVCLGRPLGIDLVAAARNGIHVHIYGNEVDDIALIVAQGLGLGSLARLEGLARRYIHLHAPLQPIGGSLDAIRAAKDRWVEEFSRYDAGWSYVKHPLPWPRLEDEAVIPNRHGTYLLAGLPIIIEQLPGYYRYDTLRDCGVAIDFIGRDYHRLARFLRARTEIDELHQRARRCRAQFTFDATVDKLLDYLGQVCERRSVRASTRHDISTARHHVVQLPTRPVSLRTFFAKKAVPGRLKNRIVIAAEIAVSRARWIFASAIAKAYVGRILNRCRQGQDAEVESRSPRTRSA